MWGGGGGGSSFAMGGGQVLVLSSLGQQGYREQVDFFSQIIAYVCSLQLFQVETGLCFFLK